jgi:hypothetical protein
MTRRLRINVSILFAALAALVVFFLARQQFREARFYAVDSYVRSVCSAVDSFSEKHGHLPQSLDEIDKSILDYDVHIRLQQLDYEVTDAGYRVSYLLSDGREVSCP